MNAPLPFDSLAYALTRAAEIVAGVLAGQSLAEGQLGAVPPVARPGVQEIVYGCLRRYGLGDFVLDRLSKGPIPDLAVRALLLVALYRLETRPDKPHMVVDQAVEAAARLGTGRARGLVNAILRQFLREQDTLTRAAQEVPAVRHGLPHWWLERLQADWPADWESIAAQSAVPPPMALRVNSRRIARVDALASLTEAGLTAHPLGAMGLNLAHPVPVDRIPGFADGLLSVQDPGAQRAAELLAPHPGSRVLDACAAPGGKTAHLLEQADLDLLALDLKPARCRRIEENLTRLHLSATVRVADCTRLATWWDGRPFDAVLADVPCSASGVVRRHPDAKWLRQPDDVSSFARSQARILDALWQVVAPGGKLLYATCSVFAEENDRQIRAFLVRQPKATLRHEEFLLPTAEHDGFYYCLLIKPA